MSFQWIVEGDSSRLVNQESTVLIIPGRPDCQDAFEAIGEKAWRWTRRSSQPVTEMKMTL